MTRGLRFTLQDSCGGADHKGMLRLALATFTTLFLACAGAEPSISSDASDAAQTGTLEAAAAAPVEAPVCRVVFSPDPELLDETVAATARWAAATGCDIGVAEGGIAVRLVEQGWMSGNGTTADGHTFTTERQPGELPGTNIEIDIARTHRALSLLHEIGHVLRWDDAHIEDAPAALMFHDGGRGRITAEDVTYACSGPIACMAFVPEG